ncbi:oxidoreductase [Opitutaceae bacterium EW11]|nr:oxidoreductase [Opitutaceae bacterium EW11]
MKKLGLGVLGLGEGRSIISAGMQSPLWEVTALCDLNEDLCRQRCAEFGLKRYTTSMDELLADPNVDVVGIYTPDQLHAQHVVRALSAGKHVVCTKPFLDNLKHAKSVLDAAARSGKRVMVGQSSRHFAPFARQREHFQSGVFGDLITVEAYYHADHRWFLKKPWAKLDSFRWLYGCISHPGDLLRWYLPDVDEVMGYSLLSPNGRELGLVHPDTFHFVVKAKSGLIGRVSGAYSGPVVPTTRDSNMSCILRAAKGASQADYFDLRYAWKIEHQSVLETFEDRDDYFFRFGGHSHHAGEYQNYLEYFARCVESGETPRPDVSEGIVTVAMMQAMEESSQTGRPVRVADVLVRHGLGDLAG